MNEPKPIEVPPNEKPVPPPAEEPIPQELPDLPPR